MKIIKKETIAKISEIYRNYSKILLQWKIEPIAFGCSYIYYIYLLRTWVGSKNLYHGDSVNSYARSFLSSFQKNIKMRQKIEKIAEIALAKTLLKFFQILSLNVRKIKNTLEFPL